MPTLEVQLAKAENDLANVEKAMGIYPSTWGWGWGRPNRADTLHGNMAERRGLIQRIRYLQQRLAARNERASPPEVDLVSVRLAEYQSLALPTHTSAPTVPA